MNSDEILNIFHSISVRKVKGVYSPYKPLLLLYALSRCYLGKGRLYYYSEIDRELNRIVNRVFINCDYRNFHYAFVRLKNDNVWEIDSATLRLSDSGDPLKSELFDKNISAGFTEEIYTALKSDKKLILSIVNHLLNQYFPHQQHSLLLSALNFPIKNIEDYSVKVADVKSTYKNKTNMDAMNCGENHMAKRHNGYIAYLNSLHNVSASSANALAESQALNSYFTGIYQPFPIVDDIYQALIENKERVIVLTGHAGDGKSTVALDVLKQLRNLPPDKPLNDALMEREDINHSNGKMTIVKDMSELTAQQRLEWLEQGFTEPGSWLIVSNTGPLIHSLNDYTKKIDGNIDIESDILECLERPYENGNLAQHIVNGYNKELVILNMTRLDNVSLGAKVLTKIVNHSAWEQCLGCEAEVRCPILLNRNALRTIEEIVEERVRWIYQRLNSYEQRLTLRQMVAHLALSLTGGLNCKQAHNLCKSSYDSTSTSNDSVEQIIFSETFFGYRRGEPWAVADNLRAIALVRRSVFGGPASVDFERQLLNTGCIEGISLSDELKDIQELWRKRANDAAGVRWRFALRRMLFFFGQQFSPITQQSEEFFSAFLQSPRLRDYDRWRYEGGMTVANTEKRALLKRCLRVLLEIYSGFSADQFEGNDSLYLTLRRPDRLVIQPTQLIVAKLENQDFTLQYDAARRVPKLAYKNGLAELTLTLPLLDYIHSRSLGQLGNELSPIHLAQLEWFRAELLEKSNPFPDGEIGLLRSGVDGKVEMHRFVIDEQKQELEKY